MLLAVFTDLTTDVPEDTSGLEAPYVFPSDGLETMSGLTGWGADDVALPGNDLLGVLHLNKNNK